MQTTHSNGDSQRMEARISSMHLELEIRKSRPFNLGRFHSCVFVDINTGGVGLVSDIQYLRVLDRVDLRVHHSQRSYFVRGIIGYRQEVGSSIQYGIIFVEVPSELDLQIKSETRGNCENIDTPPTADSVSGAALPSGSQRRHDIRKTSPVMSVAVKKSGVFSADSYSKVTMVDISRYGIGLVADSVLFELTAEVDLILGHGDVTFAVKGTVCSCFETDHQYRYGVQFRQVPPEYTRLVESS